MNVQSAFPWVEASDTQGVEFGMTMRQYYKAAAMKGYLAAFSGSDVSMPNPLHAVGYCAEIADAMLAEDASHASGGPDAAA